MSDGPRELRSGRYVLLRTLGEGAQGETWEAGDRGTVRSKDANASLSDQWSRYVGAKGVAQAERIVAIKCFRLNKAKAWKDVELAEREARTLASLSHAHLPHYIEHFEEDGALYLVMEKISGDSLAKIRSQKKTLAPDEVRRMLNDLSSALEYLHGRAPAIVHRDIKPGNVIRRPDGSFALVDFGAVRDRLKPAGGSTVVGTFGYMAPEQFQGRASPKSDVYGAAATALAMLTGVEPEDLPHRGLAIDVAAALPAGVSKELRRALEAMLEPDPDRRPGSIAEALALAAPPPPPRESEPSKKQRRKERRAEKSSAKRRVKTERADVAVTRPPWPILSRLFARAGLLIAFVMVSLTVGVFTPLVLMFLSLFFGQKLRDAARASVRATKRAQNALGRASDRVGGRPPRIRIANEVRVAPSLVNTPASLESADDFVEELFEGDRQEEERHRREQMRKQARKKHWGR